MIATAQTSICVIASAQTAQAEGIDRKVLLLTIDSVASDGIMNLLATAWSVPH